MVSTARLCVICKGKGLCGNKRCPLITRIQIKPKIEKSVSIEFFGPSISVFVGRVGYPNINIGPLGAIEFKRDLDNPNSWFGKDYSEIIELRSYTLRSKYIQNVYSKSIFIEKIQELALSSKPVDIEMYFKRKPVMKLSFSDIIQPMGPSATLKKLRITENPKIQNKVEKIINDEIKTSEACFLLYKKGEDVYKITTILSSGVLGLKENKKLVPTRWSITCIDDIIAKNLIEKIKEYPSINQYLVYSSEYLFNHFEILLIPGKWEYENFEAWAPGSFWSKNLKKPMIVEEYESFKGRTSYADKEGGGYYAARLGVVEGLNKIKKQAKVVVFREVYEGYTIPLGVWVVRETVRNAFKNKPKRFEDLKSALNYINLKLKLPLKEYIKKSKILQQKRLIDFIKLNK